MKYLNVWVEQLTSTTSNTCFVQAVLKANRSNKPQFKVVDELYFSGLTQEELQGRDCEEIIFNNNFSIELGD